MTDDRTAHNPLMITAEVDYDEARNHFSHAGWAIYLDDLSTEIQSMREEFAEKVKAVFGSEDSPDTGILDEIETLEAHIGDLSRRIS